MKLVMFTETEPGCIFVNADNITKVHSTKEGATCICFTDGSYAEVEETVSDVANKINHYNNH